MTTMPQASGSHRSMRRWRGVEAAACDPPLRFKSVQDTGVTNSTTTVAGGVVFQQRWSLKGRRPKPRSSCQVGYQQREQEHRGQKSDLEQKGINAIHVSLP